MKKLPVNVDFLRLYSTYFKINLWNTDDLQDGTHALIDKLEHELGAALNLTDHMKLTRYAKFKSHINELKVKLAESELAFGQH